jgi:hypothetical protein
MPDLVQRAVAIQGDAGLAVPAALPIGLVIGLLRKEHLGTAALVLAWIGLLALTVARRRDDAAVGLSRLAFVAYSGAAFVAVIAAGAGLIVGAHWSF